MRDTNEKNSNKKNPKVEKSHKCKSTENWLIFEDIYKKILR